MKKAAAYRHRRQVDRVLSWVVTAILCTFCLAPLYWVFITSLKPTGGEYALPVEYWPAHPTIEAYRTVLGELGFLQNLRNSFVVSATVSVVCLAISALSAYAVARLRFKYKIQSLLFLQLAWMIPPVVTIAPTFYIMRRLELTGTLAAMIVPNIFYCVPLATWLLACYFAELPFELEDAAKLDGWKPIQIFWRVILPLAAPGLFSAGIFAFLGSWGEFMLAAAVTMGATEVQTVPVAVLNFTLGWRLQWTWISAGIVLSLIPVVLLVIVFQRWVIQGLTAGAVKY